MQMTILCTFGELCSPHLGQNNVFYYFCKSNRVCHGLFVAWNIVSVFYTVVLREFLANEKKVACTFGQMYGILEKEMQMLIIKNKKNLCSKTKMPVLSRVFLCTLEILDMHILNVYCALRRLLVLTVHPIQI